MERTKRKKLIKDFVSVVSTVSCLILMTAGTSGCGESVKIPETLSNLVPTSGTVTLDGKPLKGATVTFIPVGDDAVRQAQGITDEKGKYVLITNVNGQSDEQNKGAIVGKYKVVINLILTSDGSPLPSGTTEADAMEKGAKEALLSRYSSEEKSILKAEVSEITSPEKSFNFDLKSK